MLRCDSTRASAWLKQVADFSFSEDPGLLDTAQYTISRDGADGNLE